MPWIIQSEYIAHDGRRECKTERVNYTPSTLAQELKTAAERHINAVLADCADDESDLTITIAYQGKRS